VNVILTEEDGCISPMWVEVDCDTNLRDFHHLSLRTEGINFWCRNY